MIPVGWLTPGDQWDTTMIDQLLHNQLYPTGLEFEHHQGYPPGGRGVLIVPGRYWADRMPEIEEAVASYEWLLLIRTSDEEDLFDVRQFDGPSRTRFWVQTPRADRDYGDSRLFGVGYPQHFTNVSPETRELDVFLSAQDTHDRRHQCFAALDKVKKAYVQANPGFTQGMLPQEYVRLMASAKVAPSPSGAFGPDSFRVYEALQAHTVPIVDGISPGYDAIGYWRNLFPDIPFPILYSYSDLPGYINDLRKLWPANSNRVTAWWMRQKRLMTTWLLEDLRELGAL